MNFAISVQLREFLYAGLLGVSLGVFYDVLAIIRSYIKVNKLINLAFDVLFWIFAIIALFAFVLFFTKGNLRLYILLGNFSGIFIYKNTISPLFFRGVRIIIELAVRFLHFICKPLYKLFKTGSEKDGKEKEKAQGVEYDFS